MMLALDDPRAPKYWMYETSGILIRVVDDYLNGRAMTFGQVAIMKAYLRQWIMSPVWEVWEPAEALEPLRRSVEQIQTQRDLHEWLEAALEEGIDPL